MSEVMESACRMLARREYSVRELKRKLETRFPGHDEIEPTVTRLAEEGMVCDRRFAAAFVRSRVAKWQGPLKIRAELSRRGIEAGVVDEALDTAVDSWTRLAGEWLSRQGPLKPDYDSRAKYYRRLANRGFTHDQAMDALQRMSDPAEGF